MMMKMTTRKIDMQSTRWNARHVQYCTYIKFVHFEDIDDTRAVDDQKEE